jgi:hypothetical protein
MMNHLLILALKILVHKVTMVLMNIQTKIMPILLTLKTIIVRKKLVSHHIRKMNKIIRKIKVSMMSKKD